MRTASKRARSRASKAASAAAAQTLSRPPGRSLPSGCLRRRWRAWPSAPSAGAGAATVTTVPVYQWGLPLNQQPLIQSVERLCRGEFDVVIFTTGVQLDHLLEVAAEHGKRDQVLEHLRGTFLASIGPTCSETLQGYGLTPDLEPSHPKMGILVREAGLDYGRRRAT